MDMMIYGNSWAHLRAQSPTGRLTVPVLARNLSRIRDDRPSDYLGYHMDRIPLERLIILEDGPDPVQSTPGT